MLGEGIKQVVSSEHNFNGTVSDRLQWPAHGKHRLHIVEAPYVIWTKKP